MRMIAAGRRRTVFRRVRMADIIMRLRIGCRRVRMAPARRLMSMPAAMRLAFRIKFVAAAAKPAMAERRMVAEIAKRKVIMGREMSGAANAMECGVIGM